MAIENVVVAYTADINDITSKVKTIQRINNLAAKQLGSEFTKSINIVSSQLKKVQFDKQFKIEADDGKLKKVTGTLNTFERQIKTADGKMFKFTETLGTAEGQTVPLASSITAVNAKANTLIGTSSKLSTNFSSLTNVNRTFSKELGNFGRVSTLVGTSMNKITDSGRQVSKIFQTADGRFVKLTETVKKLPNGIQNVTRNVQQLTKEQVQSTKVLEGNNKFSRNFADNLKTLARRAALTIPIWFALRQSIQSVTRTFRDGIKDIISFDRVLQKLGRNLRATSTDFEKDFANTTKAIEEFSARSGISVEELTNSIQKFATVGFSPDEALAGGLQTAKASVILFNDAEDAAEAFANSIRVFTEGLGTTEERQKTLNEGIALMTQLQQTNNFELDKATQNLSKFAGVAKVAGLDLNETLGLLATLGTAGLGERGGRLLRTTVLKALGDIEGITRTLDFDFDPSKQPTIVFIQELVKNLGELRSAEGVPEEMVGAIQELFNIRSSEVVGALASLPETLQKNLDLLPDLKGFEESFENQNKQINRLAARFTNLNKEIGRTFVSGLLGGENFQQTLEKIIKSQENLLKNTDRFAQIVKDAFVTAGVTSVVAFTRHLGFTNLSLTSTIALLTRLRALALAPISPIAITALITFGVLRFKDEAERLAKEAEDQSQTFNDIGERIAENIRKGLRKELTATELTDLVIEIETFGADNLGFDEATIARVLDLLKEIKEEELAIAEAKKNQEETTKREEINQSKRKEVAELVLKSELDLLKARGALTSEIIQAEQLARRKLGIEKEILGQVEDQLAREKAISEERRLRANVGSDEIKLFRIAQTEGVDVARRIGEVLAGNLDFSTFVRQGGQALEVFKDQFEDIFESQQARAFFSGDPIPGLKGLRGGSLIPTEQQFDQRVISGFSTQVSLAQSRAEAQFRRFQELSKRDRSTSATDKNTEAINKSTVSIESLIATFEAGVPLFGQQAQRVVQFQATGQDPINPIRAVQTQRQIIDLNLNIDGREFNLSGTPEGVQRLANQAGEEVGRQVRQLINDIANNPESPGAQAVRRRIVEE